METWREDVVRIAHTWERTPYKPNAALKGIGVDCIQFLAMVYAEAGVVDISGENDLLENNYDIAIHQHQNDRRYLEGILRHAEEITEEELQPGDLVLYGMVVKHGDGTRYHHGAIVIAWPDVVIHASMRGVITSRGTKGLFYKKPFRCFTLRKKK